MNHNEPNDAFTSENEVEARTEVEPREEEVFKNGMKDSFLDGIELHPYSPSRKVAAQSMGLVYPFVGEEGFSRLEAGNPYPGAMMDVGVILWLCSLPDKRSASYPWDARRALSKPNDAVEEVIKFLDEHKLTNLQGKAFFEAFAKFMSIVQDVEDSQFEPVLEGGSGAEEALPKV